jgi:hypothetical protein
VQIIIDGGSNGQTRTLVYSIFDNVFHNNSNVGPASAQGLVLLVIGVLLFPVLLTVVGGFLPSSSLLHQPPQLFGGDWTAENYVEAWNQPVVPLALAFGNSLFVGIAIMLGPSGDLSQSTSQTSPPECGRFRQPVGSSKLDGS